MNKNVSKPIYVTKSFLPPIDEYKGYVDAIWASEQLTNQGPLLRTFEEKVENLLDIDNFHFVANGTLALQLAIRAVGANGGEIITTPFSYVATTSAILWEGSTPVFVDIDPETLCIDSEKIEAAITPQTKAILAVHVFGNACNIDNIQKIADKHNLKVIYDGAHAFGVNYNGKSLLSYGDVSITSFHATKPFHTIEGGGVFTNSKAIGEKIELMKRFGHNNDEHIMLGFNAKASEFQAAMGLTNLNHLDEIFADRKRVFNTYNKHLNTEIQRPRLSGGVVHNYSYYPIILKDPTQTSDLLARLKEESIFPRRYFYPSLNQLPYIQEYSPAECPVSVDVSQRILCLPVYVGLKDEDIGKITNIINEFIG